MRWRHTTSLSCVCILLKSSLLRNLVSRNSFILYITYFCSDKMYANYKLHCKFLIQRCYVRNLLIEYVSFKDVLFIGVSKAGFTMNCLRLKTNGNSVSESVKSILGISTSLPFADPLGVWAFITRFLTYVTIIFPHWTDHLSEVSNLFINIINKKNMHVCMSVWMYILYIYSNACTNYNKT